MTARIQAVEPEGWKTPKGYANGMIARGRTLFVAGQIGWDTTGKLTSTAFVPQFQQALDNVLTVVKTAGGAPTDIVKMTIYATDVGAYRAHLREVGEIWKARLDRHYPAMALVGVTELVDPGALVEIEAVAALEEA